MIRMHRETQESYKNCINEDISQTTKTACFSGNDKATDRTETIKSMQQDSGTMTQSLEVVPHTTADGWRAQSACMNETAKVRNVSHELFHCKRCKQLQELPIRNNVSQFLIIFRHPGQARPLDLQCALHTIQKCSLKSLIPALTHVKH